MSLRRFCLRVRFAILGLAGSAASAFGQGGPPMLTDDPGTPAQGHWEINFAFVTEHSRDGAQTSESPLLDLNYGATDRLQIKYDIPWVIAREPGEASRAGLGNSNFGLKWRFYDDAAVSGLAISTFPQLEFNNPTSSADRGLVDHGVSFLLPFEFQGKLGPLDWDAELGRSFAPRGDNAWLYGVALGHELNSRVELAVELHGTGRFSWDEDELIVNLGVRWKVAEHQTLLVSAGRSVNHTRGTEFTFVGYLGVQQTF